MHFFSLFYIVIKNIDALPRDAGNARGEPKPSNVARSGAPQKVLPIEVPALTLGELNRLTGNFGSKALVGEGSYGRVFLAKLSNGQQAAVKKLDTSSSEEPDSEFEAQVILIFQYTSSVKRNTTWRDMQYLVMDQCSFP